MELSVYDGFAFLYESVHAAEGVEKSGEQRATQIHCQMMPGPSYYGVPNKSTLLTPPNILFMLMHTHK